MRRVPLVLAVLLALSTQAFATWSVIAVDRKTGEVVIASATCVSQDALMRFPALSLKDIQAIIIPGKGVAAAQANVTEPVAGRTLSPPSSNEGPTLPKYSKCSPTKTPIISRASTE
jgi:hypothetical protein